MRFAVAASLCLTLTMGAFGEEPVSPPSPPVAPIAAGVMPATVSTEVAAPRRELANGLGVVAIATGTGNNMEALLRFERGWADDPTWAPGALRLVLCASLGEAGMRSEFRDELPNDARVEVLRHETLVHVRAPVVKGPWVLNEMAQRLFRTVPSQDALQSCYGKLRDAGKPWHRSLGDRIEAGLHPLRWPRPGFLTTRYGLAPEPAPGRPRYESLIDFRAEALGPRSATLFYSGAFKADRIASFVTETFGSFEDRSQPTERREPILPRSGTFRRMSLASGAPHIEAGLHFAAQSVREYVALELYLRYLALRYEGIAGHRVGAPEAHVALEPERVGTATVRFRPSREHFRTARDAFRGLVAEERDGAEVDNTAWEEVRSTWLRDGSAAEDAHRQFRLAAIFQTKDDAEAAARALTATEARGIVFRLWKDGGDYEVLEAPPYFFSGEWLLLALLAAAWGVAIARRALLRPFESRALRYMRRVRYQVSVSLVLGGIFVALLYGYRYVFRWLDRGALAFPALQGNLVFGAYLPFVFYVAGATTLFLLYLSRFPRKIIITEQELVLKSFTYGSRSYPLDALEEIGNCRLWDLVKRRPLRDLRLFYWPMVRRGLALRVRGLGLLFLGVTDARRVHRELAALVAVLRKKNEGESSSSQAR